MIKFSERLKELRIEMQLTQYELGNALFVDQRTISHWENDYCKPDFEMLAKMAVYFDVSAGYLLGLED